MPTENVEVTTDTVLIGNNNYPLARANRPAKKKGKNAGVALPYFYPHLTTVETAASFFADILTAAERNKPGNGLLLADKILHKHYLSAFDAVELTEDGAFDENILAIKLSDVSRAIKADDLDAMQKQLAEEFAELQPWVLGASATQEDVERIHANWQRDGVDEDEVTRRYAAWSAKYQNVRLLLEQSEVKRQERAQKMAQNKQKKEEAAKNATPAA